MNKQNIIAYTAGYIDGDGCLYVGKTVQKPKMISVYEYSIQIVSVKRGVLDTFQTEFGGYIRTKPFKEGHRDAYCLTVKGRDALALAENIIPYLVEKVDQCKMFVQFSNLIKRNDFKPVSKELIDSREELINSIREDKHIMNLITREAIEALKDQKLTVTPVDKDYAYLAGLIDSEGCFRIKKWKPKNRPNDVYSICVEIGNTKLPIMPFLIKRFGGSVNFIPEKPNKRASAIWTLSAAALFEILPKIRPILTSKKEVCDKLIEFQETILPNGGDRNSELFRALFEKRREVRERIIKEVHEFNLKGLK